MKLLLTGAFKYTDQQIEYLKSLGTILFMCKTKEKKSNLM